MECYRAAAAFYQENHHLDVRSDFVTADGIKLGTWIRTNRAAFANRALSPERIRLLRQIGMIWNVDEYRWMKNYEVCRDYYLEHGQRISSSYLAADGSMPGKWLHSVVLHHLNGDPNYTPLRDDQIKLLEQIGVVFEKRSDAAWNRAIAAVEEYYYTHNNLDVPGFYVSGSGVKLRSWLDYQRRSYAGMTHSVITNERKAQLDRLGFDWALRKTEDTWPLYYSSLQAYMQAHGGSTPGQKYVDS